MISNASFSDAKVENSSVEEGTIACHVKLDEVTTRSIEETFLMPRFTNAGYTPMFKFPAKLLCGRGISVGRDTLKDAKAFWRVSASVVETCTVGKLRDVEYAFQVFYKYTCETKKSSGFVLVLHGRKTLAVLNIGSGEDGRSYSFYRRYTGTTTMTEQQTELVHKGADIAFENLRLISSELENLKRSDRQQSFIKSTGCCVSQSVFDEAVEKDNALEQLSKSLAGVCVIALSRSERETKTNMK
jgi:hypothetical protein